MTARIVALAALLVTVLLVQSVVAPALMVAGVQPDLVVLVVVGVGLAGGPATGARVGFAAGLALDLLTGGPQLVGVGALVHLLVGYAAGVARRHLTGAQLAGQVVVGGVATALVVGSQAMLAVLLDQSGATMGSVLRTAALAGVYGAALAPVVCGLVAAVTRRVPVSATRT